MCSSRGKRFSQDEMEGPNFETETVKSKSKWYFTNMQSQMTSLIPWFDGLYERTFYSCRCFQTLRNWQNIRERYLSNQRRLQIFSLANDWSNPVTCLNMPYSKTGERYSLGFKTARDPQSSRFSLSCALRKLFASLNRSCPRTNFTPDGGYCFYI